MGCVGGAWDACGRCMGCVWEVYGMCVGGASGEGMHEFEKKLPRPNRLIMEDNCTGYIS